MIGRAWFSYWPLDDLGFVPHVDYGEMPDRLVATPTTESR
jgi:hypothetical protein